MLVGTGRCQLDFKARHGFALLKLDIAYSVVRNWHFESVPSGLQASATCCKALSLHYRNLVRRRLIAVADAGRVRRSKGRRAFLSRHFPSTLSGLPPQRK